MKLKHKLLILITAFSGIIAVGVLPASTSALFEGSQKAACNGANFSTNSGDCAGGNRRDTYNQASNTIERTVKNIINLLTVIVGIIAVIMLIINGLRFITSNGDAAKISSARNGVIFAIVGLVIVALAQVIVRFVLARA